VSIHKISWSSAFALALFSAAIPSVRADALFSDPGSHASNTVGSGLDGNSLGAEFTYVGPGGVTVTDLGLLDVGGQTWDQSHEIGLWDLTAGNTLIADATVDNSGTLIDGFRYVQLATPVPLTSGDAYILAAYYGPGSSDLVLNCCGSGVAPTNDPEFTVLSGVETFDGFAGHLVEPGPIGGDAYMGPNLLFTPEPGTFVLLLSGFCLIACRSSRIMRRARAATMWGLVAWRSGGEPLRRPSLSIRWERHRVVVRR
jgi:hypothetical protein